jgi:hypothetical protein
MTKITSLLLTLASLLALGLSTAPAQPLNTRSFISANGLDTNACTRTAPCRTLQKAHDSTSASGDINMLDPAEYGTVTITKAISIVNDGVGSAGILVPAGQNGININAAATDKINLRGLIIEGAASGVNGIVFIAGASLTIDNCVTRNLTDTGILFAPSAASALSVSNTVAAHNGQFGMRVFPRGSGTVTASFNRVEVYGNAQDGLIATGSSSTGTIKVAVTDSVAANNGDDGFSVDTTSAVTTLTLIRSMSANNGTGLASSGAASGIRIGQSAVTGNSIAAWDIVNSGTVATYGDNYIDGNGFGGALSPLPKK